MSPDKSPGPDGFSMAFYQTFWDVIKVDLMNLFAAIYSGSYDMRRFNYSDITLIPKCDGASKVSDFRPISLLNCSLKIFTKVLANRLGPLLDSLVSSSQSAFLKRKSTLDCFLVAHEIVNLCSRKKLDMLMLKIDFRKAFDSVSWVFIEELLTARGFGSKWCSWIHSILHTAKSSILINGVRGSTIACKRGLKQGDPLSPMIFILVVDVLAKMMEQGRMNGVLSCPSLRGSLSHISILQFADDTLLFCDGQEQDVIHLKLLLNIFADVSGLAINFAKSSMIYFGKSVHKQAAFSDILGCVDEELPIKYLGLPLMKGKLRKKEWMPIINKIERRLSSWKGKLLSRGGRLILINSVLSALPLYYASFFKFPTWVISKIDQLRSRFLWKGTDSVKRGFSNIQWGRVCRPKTQGGLGVLEMKTFNQSLLLKWWWRLAVQDQSLSVQTLKSIYFAAARCQFSCPASASFFWKGLYSLHSFFSACVSWEVGNGSFILFWKDNWVRGSPISHLYPNIFKLAWNENATFLSQGKWVNGTWIWNPATRRLRGQSLIDESVCLKADIEHITPGSGIDIPYWKPATSGSFSVKGAYIFLINGGMISPYAKFTWNPLIPLKCKIFVWLLSWNKLFSKDNLSLRGWTGDISCCSCNCQLETSFHIFFECPIALEVWSFFTSRLHTAPLPSSIHDCFTGWTIIDQRPGVSKFWHIIIFVVLWSLWLERNARIFQNKFKSPNLIISNACYFLSSWINAPFPSRRKEIILKAIHEVGAHEFLQRGNQWNVASDQDLNTV